MRIRNYIGTSASYGELHSTIYFLLDATVNYVPVAGNYSELYNGGLTTGLHLLHLLHRTT
jgi:hypothetical protein